MVFKLRGLPRSIVIDRDPIFLSKFWTQLFILSGTTLLRSTSYHPRTDGLTEVVNRCLQQYLRCFVAENTSIWVSLLPVAKYVFNTSYHSSAGMVSFQILYGRSPPSTPLYIRQEDTLDFVNDLLQDKKKLLSFLKENLKKAQVKMKLQTDKHRRSAQFNVGELVMVKLQSINSFCS